MIKYAVKYLCAALIVFAGSGTGARGEWIVQENEVRDEFFEGIHIKSIVCDDTGGTWILDQQKHLYRSDDSGWLMMTDNEGDSIQSLFVIVDAEDNIWCASPDVMKYDKNRNEWRTVLRSGEDYHGQVKCMAVGMHDELWAGISGEGLLHYDGEKVELLTSDDGVSSDIVNAIGIDFSNSVWIVTDALGIAQYNHEEKRVTTVFAESIDVVVSALYIDTFDRVWLGHDTGVIVIDGDEPVFLDWRNGFPGLHVNDIHVDENHNTWIACGTLAGYHQTGNECGSGSLICIHSLDPSGWSVYPSRFDAVYTVAALPGEHILLCGTYCGLVSVNIDDIPMEVTGTLPISQPSILGIYPNPFNPSTTISFSLQRKEAAELFIYDAVGQKIAAVVNDTLPPGHYSYCWNADMGNQTVSSGIYFAVLKTSSGIVTNKMLLLR